MKFNLLVLSLLGFLIGIAYGHSFMSCVDYDFGASHCKAYPRNFRFQEFQGDRYLYQLGKFTKPNPTRLGIACGPAQKRFAPVTNQYTEKYPMGVFAPGQRVCSQWPARNHATQPRAGNVSFFLSNKKGNNDPEDDTQETFFKNQIISKPFGNCTDYFENTNNATCTACYNIPIVDEGLYVLQWFWEFNPEEYYMTCADIIVSGKAQNINQAQQQQTQQQQPRVQQQQQQTQQQQQQTQQQQPRVQQPQHPSAVSLRDTPLFGQVKQSNSHEFTNELAEFILMEDGQFNKAMVKDIWSKRMWVSPLKYNKMNTIEMYPDSEGSMIFACSDNTECFNGKYFDKLHFYVKGSVNSISSLMVEMVSPRVTSVKPIYIESMGIVPSDGFNHFTLSLPDDQSYSLVRVYGGKQNLNDNDHVFIGKISLTFKDF